MKILKCNVRKTHNKTFLFFKDKCAQLIDRNDNISTMPGSGSENEFSIIFCYSLKFLKLLYHYFVFVFDIYRLIGCMVGCLINCTVLRKEHSMLPRADLNS